MKFAEETRSIEAGLVSYCTSIDRRDWSTFRQLFTPTCTLDYGEVGQWTTAAEIAEYMDRTHAPMGHTLHRLSNLVVQVQADATGQLAATARSYVDVLLTKADGTGGINAAGFYDDRWTHGPAGWQISARTSTRVRLSSFVNEPLASRH